MKLSWRDPRMPDAPRERVAMSAGGEGWFWIVYPSSSTRWKLQLIRGDLSEYPMRDDAFLSFEDAVEMAQEREDIVSSWAAVKR